MPVLMWHARACRKPSTPYGCQSTNKTCTETVLNRASVNRPSPPPTHTVDNQFLYPALNFILLASMETQNDHVYHSSTIFWLTHSVAPHRPRGSVLRALIPPHSETTGLQDSRLVTSFTSVTLLVAAKGGATIFKVGGTSSRAERAKKFFWTPPTFGLAGGGT